MEVRLAQLARMTAAAPILVALLAAGCVSMGSFLAGNEGPPTGPVCQVVATWNNEVVYVPDPTQGGKLNPGLSGRLYLFGPTQDGFPRACDGRLVVDLYDETRQPITDNTLPLEEWRFDKDTLHRLLHRDMIGWGYTLFLPWGTFKPDIRQVRLKLRFEPVDAMPLYDDSLSLTLSKNTRTETNHQTVPGQPGQARPN